VLEHIIVGGGIQGTHLSLVLTATGKVARDRLVVVDPFDEPLERWTECTSNVQMEFLRSPAVHHIDVEPFSLYRFAKSPAGRKVARFAPPYDRPSLALFAHHCEHVVNSNRLRDLRVKAEATRIEPAADRVRVHTTTGVLEAKRVTLALGLAEQPHWPLWAQALRQAGAPVGHVLEAGYRLPAEGRVGSAVVIGGGITAGQVALHLSRTSAAPVKVLVRHDLRVHQFDSDPGWLGPKFMDTFSRERCAGKRRSLILEARHRGSMPEDIHNEFSQAVRAGKITLERMEVTNAALEGAEVVLRGPGRAVRCNFLVLATGFDRHRPGNSMIDRLITEHGLACAACGYPIVDAGLRWGPRISVMGPLAELELGPVARNISGARRGAERLARAVA
jgi:hypothetical protein